MFLAFVDPPLNQFEDPSEINTLNIEKKNKIKIKNNKKYSAALGSTYPIMRNQTNRLASSNRPVLRDTDQFLTDMEFVGEEKRHVKSARQASDHGRHCTEDVELQYLRLPRRGSK